MTLATPSTFKTLRRMVLATAVFLTAAASSADTQRHPSLAASLPEDIASFIDDIQTYGHNDTLRNGLIERARQAGKITVGHTLYAHVLAQISHINALYLDDLPFLLLTDPMSKKYFYKIHQYRLLGLLEQLAQALPQTGSGNAQSYPSERQALQTLTVISGIYEKLGKNFFAYDFRKLQGRTSENSAYQPIGREMFMVAVHATRLISLLAGKTTLPASDSKDGATLNTMMTKLRDSHLQILVYTATIGKIDRESQGITRLPTLRQLTSTQFLGLGMNENHLDNAIETDSSPYSFDCLEAIRLGQVTEAWQQADNFLAARIPGYTNQLSLPVVEQAINSVQLNITHTCLQAAKALALVTQK